MRKQRIPHILHQTWRTKQLPRRLLPWQVDPTSTPQQLAIVSLLDVLHIYTAMFYLLDIELNVSHREKMKSVYDALTPDMRCETGA